MSRRRGTGSIFRKPGCAKWVIQFYKDGKRIREATGLTDRAEAQRRLTTRLFQVDRNEFAARERKPVRIEDCSPRWRSITSATGKAVRASYGDAGGI
jgi:hypothetical protein